MITPETAKHLFDHPRSHHSVCFVIIKSLKKGRERERRNKAAPFPNCLWLQKTTKGIGLLERRGSPVLTMPLNMKICFSLGLFFLKLLWAIFLWSFDFIYIYYNLPTE